MVLSVQILIMSLSKADGVVSGSQNYSSRPGYFVYTKQKLIYNIYTYVNVYTNMPPGNS